MKEQDDQPNPVAIIIIVVITIILGLITVYSQISHDRDVHAKAVRDSINASRQYYLDSILNYRVDTSESTSGEIKKEDLDK